MLRFLKPGRGPSSHGRFINICFNMLDDLDPQLAWESTMNGGYVRCLPWWQWSSNILWSAAWLGEHHPLGRFESAGGSWRVILDPTKKCNSALNLGWNMAKMIRDNYLFAGNSSERQPTWWITGRNAAGQEPTMAFEGNLGSPRTGRCLQDTGNVYTPLESLEKAAESLSTIINYHQPSLTIVDSSSIIVSRNPLKLLKWKTHHASDQLLTPVPNHSFPW